MDRRAPDVKGSCESTEQAIADSRQGVVLQFGTGVRLRDIACYEWFQIGDMSLNFFIVESECRMLEKQDFKTNRK